MYKVRNTLLYVLQNIKRKRMAQGQKRINR